MVRSYSVLLLYALEIHTQDNPIPHIHLVLLGILYCQIGSVAHEQSLAVLEIIAAEVVHRTGRMVCWLCFSVQVCSRVV